MDIVMAGFVFMTVKESAWWGECGPDFIKCRRTGLKVKTPVARGFVVRRSDRCIRRPRSITLDLLGNRG
jgi:hypothetical protein